MIVIYKENFPTTLKKIILHKNSDKFSFKTYYLKEGEVVIDECFINIEDLAIMSQIIYDKFNPAQENTDIKQLNQLYV